MAKSTFFADTQGRYRYWYKKVNGLVEVKIQMKKALMADFRANAGKKAGQLVDILECGGGWYSITTVDVVWNKLFGTVTDGAKAWVSDLNTFFLKDVNANRYKFEVQKVKHIDHSLVRAFKLGQLQEKFSRRST